ncbi:MAG TPA: hypothetical protein VKA76_03280, partial [Gammaproteobacteria bacterium]|nr:hypothetical protein [Gammaproteobacteria bacterium]
WISAAHSFSNPARQCRKTLLTARPAPVRPGGDHAAGVSPAGPGPGVIARRIEPPLGRSDSVAGPAVAAGMGARHIEHPDRGIGLMAGDRKWTGDGHFHHSFLLESLAVQKILLRRLTCPWLRCASTHARQSS